MYVKPAKWRKAQRSTSLYHCPEWHEIRREILEVFRKWEQKATESKKEWKWQRGIVVHPLSESQWNRSHRSTRAGACKQWVSGATLPRTAPCWRMTGGWGACGWAVAQLDYERWGPLHGMYGLMEAEYDVQRTIERGGADSLLVPSQKSVWTFQDSCGQQGNN